MTFVLEKEMNEDIFSPEIFVKLGDRASEDSLLWIATALTNSRLMLLTLSKALKRTALIIFVPSL